MTRILLLTTLTFGCGSSVPLQVCGETGFKSVVSDDPDFECYKFQFIAQTVRKILVDSGVATEQQIRDERAHTDVHVLDVETYSDTLLGTVYGENKWGREITLGKIPVTVILLHEELHGFQAQSLTIGTPWHEGWDRNGFWAVADFSTWWMALDTIYRHCTPERGLLLESQRQGLIAAGWPVERWEAWPCPFN